MEEHEHEQCLLEMDRDRDSFIILVLNRSERMWRHLLLLRVRVILLSRERAAADVASLHRVLKRGTVIGIASLQ